MLDSLTNRLRPDGAGYRMLAMQTADDRARWKITEEVVTAHPGGSAAPVAKAADDRRLALADMMAVDR